ncbi:flagellar protein FlaG [Natroniella acetigena]|uniref:flagellar protein FlaG n=1 Tax=Natroniella acetigena TaxID=52004 RepID=UPI00200AFE25|nr:flagellar protein FlaG [Natroniella acetigena]MCK8827031.1 flagellar protein FlaG [Natroniella acetigena]
MRVSDVSSTNPAQSATQQGRGKQEATVDRVVGDQQLSNELENHQEGSRREDLNREEMEEVVEVLNDTVQSFHKNLSFEIHETSERVMGKLIDISQDEVIKEFPPEEMLDTLGRIKQAVGMIIDEKI